MTIEERWTFFKSELDNAAQLHGRQASDIRVMAVSKTRTISEIKSARDAGLDHFGENRVEEALTKFDKMDRALFPMYLIGHLQSKKVKEITRRFAGVHSIDTLALAEKLSRFRERLGHPLEILLQVNTSGEESKSGFSDEEEFADAAARIAALPCLDLKGVMTMAPFVDDEKTLRSCFAQCRRWSERIEEFVDDDIILSMGMSSDFRYAIAEGSNLLRIGSLIFGERP